MLTRENLAGVWAAVPTPWGDDDRFDEASFRENLRRYLSVGVHGVYTTDSTGEFYALDADEFRRIVDVLTEETRGHHISTAVGCTWVNTRETVERLQYAARRGIDGAHVTNPFWMPLTETAYRQFWRDIADACPEIGLVHYNTARSGHLLKGADYRWLIEEIPNLVGTKFTETDFGSLMNLLLCAPELSHFAHEGIFTPAMMFGAQGIYSWLVNVSPALMLRWYQACRHGHWEEAVRIQRRVAQFGATIVGPLKPAGYHHATIDKALAEVGGFLEGSRRTRRPYLPVAEDEFRALRRRVEDEFPDFIHAASAALRDG